MQNIFVIGFCFLRLAFYIHHIWGEIYPSSGFANREKTGFLEKKKSVEKISSYVFAANLVTC